MRGAQSLNRWQISPIMLLMLAILLLATAVRFHRLGAQSLWYDEGVAYAHSLRSLPELIPLLQRNVHVPAYFALLGMWQDLTGSAEFALRALSALCSILSIAWSYALGKRLFHPIAGLAAAALVALNSFSITYAQEARMYAMLTAVAAGGMWLFVGIWRQRVGLGPARRRKIIALGLVNALGMYTHVVYALVIAAQAGVALVWLAADRGGARRFSDILLTYLLTALLFLPWLPVALTQVLAQPNLAGSLPLDEMLRQIFGFLAFGNTFALNSGNISFVVVVFLFVGFLPLSRARFRWSLLLPLSWAVISVVAYLFLNLGERYLRFLLPAQVAVALWLGAAYGSCGRCQSPRMARGSASYPSWLRLSV